MKLFAAIIVLLPLAVSAQTPAGWQLMKDKKQTCQMAVPPGWVADKIMPSSVDSPDRKANVVFSGKPAGITYKEIAKMAKDMFKPAQVFEDSGNRTFFASEVKNGKSSWYVALNTTPVCEAQIEFRDPAFASSAKQMVESLKPAQK
jgi:hypothetical protein